MDFAALGNGTHGIFLVWRVVNIFLGLMVLAVLIPVVRRLRGGFSNAGRTFINAHILLVVAGALRAVESIIRAQPIGAASAFTTAGFVFSLASLWRQQVDKDETGRVAEFDERHKDAE